MKLIYYRVTFQISHVNVVSLSQIFHFFLPETENLSFPDVFRGNRSKLLFLYVFKCLCVFLIYEDILLFRR